MKHKRREVARLKLISILERHWIENQHDSYERVWSLSRRELDEKTLALWTPEFAEDVITEVRKHI